MRRTSEYRSAMAQWPSVVARVGRRLQILPHGYRHLDSVSPSDPVLQPMSGRVRNIARDEAGLALLKIVVTSVVVIALGALIGYAVGRQLF